MDQDLLGRSLKKRKPRLASALEKHDHNSFDDRLDRLHWLQKVFPAGYGFVMSPETLYVFDEAKITFVTGAFVATILLSASFIEHWFGNILRGRGFADEANSGLGSIIECMRRERLMHEFLLRKADRLRKIRNPFVHLKSFDHRERVTHRAMRQGKHPIAILEDDAKEALSLMYGIAVKAK
jgi:hypothetical protein